MAEYNFHKDLKVGKNTEKELTVLLWSEMVFPFYGVANVEIMSGAFKDYDVVLTTNGGMQVTFEVKTDLYARKSGNVAFETACRGSPSGLETTKADYWVYKIYTSPKGEALWWYEKPEGIKKMLQNFGTQKGGGDQGSNTVLSLVTLGQLLQHGRVVHSE